MDVILEVIDLLVCWKIHGCGCVADDPEPPKTSGRCDKPALALIIPKEEEEKEDQP
jgi:hypothetical protein